MDSCFEYGDGEAVGYENEDKPVRLDAGDVRLACWGALVLDLCACLFTAGVHHYGTRCNECSCELVTCGG